MIWHTAQTLASLMPEAADNATMDMVFEHMIAKDRSGGAPAVAPAPGRLSAFQPEVQQGDIVPSNN